MLLSSLLSVHSRIKATLTSSSCDRTGQAKIVVSRIIQSFMVCICCLSFCLPWWAWGSVALPWKGSSAKPGSSSPMALSSAHKGPGPGRRCLGDPRPASASWAEPSSGSLLSSHCQEVQCLLAPKVWGLFKQESWNSVSRACRQMSPSKLW